MRFGVLHHVTVLHPRYNEADRWNCVQGQVSDTKERKNVGMLESVPSDDFAVQSLGKYRQEQDANITDFLHPESPFCSVTDRSWSA